MNITFGEKKGFTLVELAIVIVVIGILAAISIVAYSGTQQRARDGARKADIAQIAHFLAIYQTDKGTQMAGSSGCGSGGAGNGWFNYEGGAYVTSMMHCLQNEGYTNNDIIDPSGLKACGGLTCRAYMKYNCGVDTYVFANFETLPHTTTDTDGTCATTLDTSYGMNYFVKVNIN